MIDHRLIETFSDLGFFELDADGKVRVWSEAASRLLGIGPEEVIGQSVADLAAKAVTTPESAAALEKAAGDGRSETLGWVTRKDGTRFWASEVTLPIRDQAGRITGFARVIRDITSWKTAQDQRDRLFMLSPDLMCVAGFDGFFKRVNPSFTRVLGYSEAELLARPFLDLVHPDDVEATRAATAAYAERTHDSTESFENRFRCADGSYRWLQWNSNADLSVQQIYAVARDVTADKETEAKLKEYATELERSNGELQRFAYVASHDLQEPLRAVAGCVDMLAQRNAGKLDDRSVELMKHAVDGAKRMRSLINDLLAFSRVGSKGINKQWVESRLSAEVAVKQLQAAVVDSKAAITIGPLPRLWADPVQMVQLFQNLIGNAIKFRRHEGPEIGIHAENGETETIFSVKDDGIGIAPEYQSRLFQVFQRLNRRSEYPGTGIGLAICKKIVERHGGRIWIESKLNEGATFKFAIPNGAN